ncbi:MAG: hypothetical protein AAGM67_07350 [Bacteroidota bacterium]
MSENAKPKEQPKQKVTLGRGLDIGTMNLVASKMVNGDIKSTRMRDAFLDLPATSKKMLKLSQISFTERDGEILLLGDAAMEMANMFGREARRPLSAGLVSAGEVDSLEVLGLLISSLLKEPTVPGEYCYFSVPAAPVDMDRDVVYHRGVFERIVKECGFTPVASNEAMAIIFAEAAPTFSGISISFGSGMANVALALNTIEGLTFSVGRGGDYIDQGAAKSVGSTSSRICAIKERGIDLMNPQSREEEALAFYYKNLIEYVVDQIAVEFDKIRSRFSLPNAIPMILSGGTSMVGNFLEFFNSVFEPKRAKFPIELSEVKMASNPLNAVSHGLLIQAMQEHDED